MTTLTVPELAHLLLALGLLLAAAHGFGYAMSRLNQPRVIGEILGGLLLGPTVFGAVAPQLQAAVFPSSLARAGSAPGRSSRSPRASRPAPAAPMSGV